MATGLSEEKMVRTYFNFILLQINYQIKNETKLHLMAGKVINVENFNVDTGFVGNFFKANEGVVTKNC